MCRRRRRTAASLHGWDWREFKLLPVVCCDKMAKILPLVEAEGVWPDGILDAYIAMIPKVDGDSTSLGQRPLCVLPIVHRFWGASVRLQQLQDWYQSWVLKSVFCAGGGRSSVDAWYSTALDLEESLFGALDSDVRIFFELMLSNHFILLIGAFLTTSSAVSGFPVGFGMHSFSIMLV